MKLPQDARFVATQVLTQVMGQQRSLTECLQAVPLEQPRDRALAQALCYGVLRWLPRLQALLKKLLHKPLKAKDSDIHILLLLGLYQHLYLRIPPHAATAATVNVTQNLNKPWARGLVNAVLRNFQRQQTQLLTQIDSEPAIRFAHPSWLLTQLQDQWPHHWQAIVNANNTHPPLTLRVNRRCLSRQHYQDYLQQANMTAAATPYTDSGLTLTQAVDVDQLPGFAQGWVSVQDGAAQLAAPLLNVPPGARVLDACAAPGGKTAHLLEHYDIPTLWALDHQPERVQRLNATLQRLKLTATVHCADASQPQSWWDGQPFERILLDSPCSATGVIRRHPDIKYLRQPSDITALAQQQYQLLKQLWSVLAPGGQLLYVTCSVLAQENQLQIERFLSQHPQAQELKLTVDWGHPCSHGRQILPGDANLDGFYYACLYKTA